MAHETNGSVGGLLGFSDKMRQVQRIIAQVARTNATVLVQGESGVGKSLVARAIHAASSRPDAPFLPVNCAAVPGDLLESELFGHERGAFTGAYERTAGLFERASGGTLCLDEIGDLPLVLQAKLLHVLQDGRFSRVGGHIAIPLDARVVATTNRNLGAAMASGEFREDLYYRLNVIEIRVPPLREQREAIPQLIDLFVARFCREYGRSVALPAHLLEPFLEYPWPGNVRELENVVRRLVVLGDVAEACESLRSRRGALATRVSGGPALATDDGQPTTSRPGPVLGLREIAERAARDAERVVLQEVLARVRWNRAEAARILRVSYKTLLKKLAASGLDPVTDGARASAGDRRRPGRRAAGRTADEG